MRGSRANLLSTIALIALLVIVAALSGCTEKVLQPEPSGKINISGQNNISAVDSGSDELLLVHFLDVGQGDSILIQFAGKNILK
jgi:beta-lactamase superfamily II metal-dependent hydrolase